MISRATRSLKDTGVSVSKSIFSKTKEGLGKIMRSETVSNLRSKVFYFMHDDNEENNGEVQNVNMHKTCEKNLKRNAYNYYDDNTASTVHPGRRQSINYRNQRLNTFY